MTSDFSFKTKIDMQKDGILVFATEKTLNDRFSPSVKRCIFTVNEHYTAPSKIPDPKDRLVFSSRRCRVYERFSSYKNGEWDRIHRSEKDLENKKQLQQQLGYYSNHRRTVFPPKNYLSSKSHNDIERKSKVSSSKRELMTYYESQICDMIDRAKAESDTPKNDFEVRKYNRFKPVWESENRGIGSYYDYDSPCNFENSGSTVSKFVKSAVSSRFHYIKKDSQTAVSSLYKWSRGSILPSPSKEELDNDLDDYMSEIKILKAPFTDEDNVDSFVEEYMMEAERCINLNKTLEF